MPYEEESGRSLRDGRESLEGISFVSADWSKSSDSRSVYISRMAQRSIERAKDPTSGWSLESLLNLAESIARDGPVLVGVDVVLGVSKGYWEEFHQEHNRRFEHFIEWLKGFEPGDSFFETTLDPDEWNPDRPWFAVQKGPGGLKKFTDQVSDGMLRRIDRAARAKPVFAVSGIPGTVGSATREFWRELAPRLTTSRCFAVWPFEGRLSELFPHYPVVLAETYPRLAYGAALAGALPIGIIALAKNNRDHRNLACDCLARSEWVATHEVHLGDLGPARADADDFDAFFTAAALLRCQLDGILLVDPKKICGTVEGSMLLAGPTDLNR